MKIIQMKQYYYLNIDEDTILSKICSSKEKTCLIKNIKENKFYFLFNESQECFKSIKENLKGYESIQIKSNNIELYNIFSQKKAIIAWNNNCIYFGNIIFNEVFEIHTKILFSNNSEICDINLQNKIILINGSLDYKKIKENNDYKEEKSKAKNKQKKDNNN